MLPRGIFACLAIAALFVLPTNASSAIAEKWHTDPATDYRVLNNGGDLADNGSYEIITAESAGGGTERVAVRSAATGALLAQTSLTFKVGQLWLEDVDANGVIDILFFDTVTGKLNCLTYAPGPGTLTVRWSFVASATWQLADFDLNGSLEMVTIESVGGGFSRLAVRSAATGALLAQTVQTYTVGDLWVADLDGDGHTQILFWDTVTHNLNCLTYTPGPNTLDLRWGYVAQTTWVFADFDGNGKPYLVFREAVSDPTYLIYDRNGAQVTTFHPSGAPFGSGWTIAMRTDDYDGDGRQELLLDYQYGPAPGADIMYMYESNTPVSVETAGESRRLELSASIPNPAASESRISYSVPFAGSASLRLFDVAGREVRTLLDGRVPAGPHEAIWDGRDNHGRRLPAGAYFYELSAGGQRVARRLIRLQ